jgi:hypothetical protein
MNPRNRSAIWICSLFLIVGLSGCAEAKPSKSTHNICKTVPVSAAFNDMGGGYTNHMLEALLPVDLKVQKQAAARISKDSVFYGCHIEKVELDKETHIVLVRVREIVYGDIQQPLQEKFTKAFGGKAYFW